MKKTLRPRREYSKHKTTAILSKPQKNFFVFCSVDLFTSFQALKKRQEEVEAIRRRQEEERRKREEYDREGRQQVSFRHKNVGH
jgi:hypothetical protein